ncbi:MAG: hypothetical protein HY927_05365 [Elusimicrobia bacterium]|nr:hypothetical protein [Elusimicrobiota bacterium]
MKRAIQVLNVMVKAGIIEDYAIAGAVAGIIHAEPVSTKDLDVLVPLPQTPAGLATLTSIHAYLRKEGYSMYGQHFIIGGVPVDFLDAHDPIARDALKGAIEVAAWGERTKVVRPEHLIAMALAVGRHKDCARIEALLEMAKIDKPFLRRLIRRHGLVDKWDAFLRGIRES